MKPRCNVIAMKNVQGHDEEAVMNYLVQDCGDNIYIALGMVKQPNGVYSDDDIIEVWRLVNYHGIDWAKAVTAGLPPGGWDSRAEPEDETV
jgi:hypothetical protein